jgi:hypothetical protein
LLEPAVLLSPPVDSVPLAPPSWFGEPAAPLPALLSLPALELLPALPAFEPPAGTTMSVPLSSLPQP